MRYYVTLPGGEEVAVDLIDRPGGKTDVLVEGEPVDVDAIDADGAINVRVGNRVFDLWLESDGERVGFVGSGHRAHARVESDRSRLASAASRSGDSGSGRVTAPMPGRVVKLLVSVGDEVDADTPLVVVEAMKMENELTTPAAGKVIEIHVAAGDQVESGAVLVTLGS